MKIGMKAVVLLLMLSMVPALAFAGGSAEAADAPQTVRLVYVNWEEGVAWTHFLAAVLEDELGYNVELTAADVGPAFASVAAGDQDFYMEAWLPGLHTVYTEGTDLEVISQIYSDGVTGLIVPQYMYDAGVTTVSDLTRPEVVEALRGQITGIDSGAGMMIKMEEELIPSYGLAEAGLELVPSSGPAMMAALEAAIANDEFVVGMGWQPHSMFGRLPLVILEQDGEEVFPIDDIFIMGRPGVAEDLPRVAEFFDNVYWTNDAISDLMVYISDSNLDTLEAARSWANQNRDYWESWLPN